MAASLDCAHSKTTDKKKGNIGRYLRFDVVVVHLCVWWLIIQGLKKQKGWFISWMKKNPNSMCHRKRQSKNNFKTLITSSTLGPRPSSILWASSAFFCKTKWLNITSLLQKHTEIIEGCMCEGVKQYVNMSWAYFYMQDMIFTEL